MQGGSPGDDSNLQRDLILDLLSALNGGFLKLKLENYNFAQPSSGLSCDDTRVWQNGLSLVEKIRDNNFVGRSGNVIFDEHGRRSNQTFEILEMTRDGFKVSGVWSEGTGYMKSRGKSFII